MRKIKRYGKALNVMEWELGFMERVCSRRSQLLDRIIPWITHAGSHFGMILFILLSWILTKEDNFFSRLLISYGIGSGILYAIKFLVSRKRPSLRGMPQNLPRCEIIDPSFPSAHTFYAFMMATVLAGWFPGYRIIFFAAAGLIGLTRIYLGLHYPIDVITGGLLGYGITRLLPSLNFFFPSS